MHSPNEILPRNLVFFMMIKTPLVNNHVIAMGNEGKYNIVCRFLIDVLLAV